MSRDRKALILTASFTDWNLTVAVLLSCCALGLRRLTGLQLGIHKGSTILDVGCGTSGLAEALYDAGYKRVTGVDWSEKAVSFMTERNKHKRPEMKFVVRLFRHRVNILTNERAVLEAKHSWPIPKSGGRLQQHGECGG